MKKKKKEEPKEEDGSHKKANVDPTSLQKEKRKKERLKNKITNKSMRERTVSCNGRLELCWFKEG